ncbi:MAG: hypothetical protein CVU90_10525 [Firmicutes bacterium HGW-Firmicutes-15]|nr:MAG: hypothetical protein CVU90_10525 [Firmicutes bacterium HGW-Firmicutes-15]
MTENEKKFREETDKQLDDVVGGGGTVSAHPGRKQRIRCPHFYNGYGPSSDEIERCANNDNYAVCAKPQPRRKSEYYCPYIDPE